MRTTLLVVVALLGCSKKTTKPSPSGEVRATKEADALWSLAPANTKFGFVATPRALDLVEGGAVSVQALLTQAPELGFLKAKFDELVTTRFGGPLQSLAALGINKAHGVAVFMTDTGDPVVALPIGDRGKLSSWVGFDLGTDPAKLGPLVCKPINNVSVCALTDTALAGLGKAALPAAIQGLGARGDLEGYGSDGPQQIGVVGQLERGELVVRGSATGVPPEIMSKLGTPNAPRVETSRSVAFLIASIDKLADQLPAGMQLPGGGTLGGLLASVSGPATLTISAGSIVPDLRIPLSDPAPATSLIDNCALFIPPQMLSANQEPGVCRFAVPQYGMQQLDLWVDGQQLRAGTKGVVPPGKSVAMTPLGKELARGSWSLALWGRGTMYGSTGLPGFTADLPAEGAMMIRGLAMLSEMGIGVRADQDKVSFVAGFRTIYANPTDVTTKLLAIAPADIAGGKVDVAAEIAKASPTSPFAADLAAGQGGLMVPTAVVGMLAAIAIPAFIKYTQRSKSSEAALMLNRIGRGLRFAASEHGEFPKGEAPLTPATSCCATGGRCAPDAAQWTAPMWEALGFAVSDPHMFRYSYQSDGKTATATAVGDLDCDEIEITYTLTATLGADGEATITIVEPAPNSD